MHPATSFIWRNREIPRQCNIWTLFEKSFEYTHQETCILWAADPTARLIVNGRTVRARVMRFVTPHITVEEIDLETYLHPGINKMEILHHWWGVPTFQRARGGFPGVSVVGELVKTDETWQWCEAPGFLSHSHQTLGGGTRRIRFPVGFDLVRETAEPDWRTAVRLESPAWSAPVVKETPPLERRAHRPKQVFASGQMDSLPLTDCPWPEVPGSWLAKKARYRRNLSDTEWAGLVQGREILIGSGEGCYVTLDFGQPVHGHVVLDILDGTQGATVDLTYCELKTDPCTGRVVLQEDGSFDPDFTVGSPYCDRLILRNGKQTVEIPEERTFRWLMVAFRDLRSPVRLTEVIVWSSGYPCVVSGGFQGGGAAVDQICNLALCHAEVSMSDVYVDTPGREDAQWLEDIPVRARIAGSWMGDASLRRVTLRQTVEQQAPSGKFRVFPPEDYGEQGLQCLDWGMAWPELLMDDWQWSLDTQRIHSYFPNLVRFLEAALAETNREGMLVDRSCLGDIRCSEHADFEKGEIESIPNAFFRRCLLRSAAMARAVDAFDLAKRWADHAARIAHGFARFLEAGDRVAEVWSPSAPLRGFGQAAAICAAYFRMYPRTVRTRILHAAFTPPRGDPPEGMRRWNNPTYAYRALVALSEHGMGHLASAHFLERYGPYLPDGPLPEYFLPGAAQPEDASGSHGWATAPLAWLHEYVLGIRPARGVARWIYAPVDVGWKKVEGDVETPMGHLRVCNDWENGRFSLASVPAENRKDYPYLHQTSAPRFRLVCR